MSICLTWFLISGLGELNIYHNLENFSRIGDFTWKDSVRLESLVSPIFCYSKYHQTRVVIIFPQSIFNDLKSIHRVIFRWIGMVWDTTLTYYMTKKEPS